MLVPPNECGEDSVLRQRFYATPGVDTCLTLSHWRLTPSWVAGHQY